jgi:hypothetical protein
MAAGVENRYCRIYMDFFGMLGYKDLVRFHADIVGHGQYLVTHFQDAVGYGADVVR